MYQDNVVLLQDDVARSQKQCAELLSTISQMESDRATLKATIRSQDEEIQVSLSLSHSPTDAHTH